MTKSLLLLSLCVFGGVLAQIETERTEISELNPLVQDLNVFFACKRLFTREGQGPGPIGCGSDKDDKGDFGRLFEVKDEKTLSSLLALEEIDRSVLIPPSVLGDLTLITKIAQDTNIKVILVAGDTDETFDGSEVVNLLFTQPMAFLGPRETKIIRSRLEDNEERGFDDFLWNNGVVMDFYNGKEDVTSEFCLGLGECDILGGQSVWGSVGRSPENIETILLAVKLDTNGVFHDLTFGARDTAGPLSVLLSVAESFSKSLSEIGSLNTQIVLAAFQGESFDSMGSKRFAFDVSKSCDIDSEAFNAENDFCADVRFLTFTEFNTLNLTKFTKIVILDNILTFDEPNPIFIHSNQDTLEGTLTGLLETNLAMSSVVPRNLTELPSTIINSFIQFGNFDGEGIVISAFENDVSDANPVRFSPNDKIESKNEIDGAFIQQLAIGIATSLVESAAGDVNVSDVIKDITTSLNSSFAAEIANCLTINFSCELVQNILGFSESFIRNVFLNQFATNLPSGTTSPIYYVGVHDFFEIRENKLVSGPEEFTRQFLALKLSLQVPAASVDEEVNLDCGATGNCFGKVTDKNGSLALGGCQPNRKTSVACVQQKCICSNVFFHDAVSPLIDGGGNIKAEIPEDLLEEEVFTEPRFELPRITTFQHTNQFFDILLFGLGIVVTLASYYLVTSSLKKSSNTKYKLL